MFPRTLPLIPPARRSGPLPDHATKIISGALNLPSVDAIAAAIISGPVASPVAAIVVVATCMSKVNKFQVADPPVAVGVKTFLELAHLGTREVKAQLVESAGEFFSV